MCVPGAGQVGSVAGGRSAGRHLHVNSRRNAWLLGGQVSGGSRRNDGTEKGSAWLSGLGICRPGVIGADQGGSEQHRLVGAACMPRGQDEEFCQFASQGRCFCGWLALGRLGHGIGCGSRDPARRVARYVRLRATEWTPFKAASVQLRARTDYGDACRP